MTTPQDQWKRCLELIRSRLNQQQFATWFEPIRFKSYDFETREVAIYVPSQFFYEYLEENFRQLIYLALYHVFGADTKLVYQVAVIQDEVVREEGNRTALLREPTSNRMLNRAPGVMQAVVPTSDFESFLNVEQTFDNFLEGVSNRLPRSVGQSVADYPARKTFNPLFIFGPSGCGKTHLVNAIGVRLRQKHPEKRVLYVSAHLFQVQYTDARINNKTNDFIHFYQSIDCLIVDDVQEFSGKEKTLETFFHIFNHLHLNGRQIIMTSDRPPVELKDMEERMLTRFKWGMLAELEAPDVQLRHDILKRLVRKDGLDIPEEVIDYVAEHLQDNVKTYSPLNALTENELEFLEETVILMQDYPTIPCNDCKYCMPCPYGIDIPAILLHYNKCVNAGEIATGSTDSNYSKARRAYLVSYDRAVPKLRQAARCIACGECMAHCPQSIDIPKEIRKIDRYVEKLRSETL